MKDSEKLYTAISEISSYYNINLWDAVFKFCELNNYDIEVVISNADAILLKELEKCASNERMIQKKYIKKKSSLENLFED